MLFKTKRNNSHKTGTFSKPPNRELPDTEKTKFTKKVYKGKQERLKKLQK